MVGAWFWGGDSSALRTRLKRLHDAGWVDKFRPKAVTGSREWSYQRTPQGLRVVAGEGRLAPDADRHARVLTSAEYAAHDLQIAALVTLIADRAARLIDPNGQGPLPERAPFSWFGAACGRVDPRENPMAEAHPKGGFDFDGYSVDRGKSRPGVIEPDATLLGLSHDEGDPDAVLIEYDRTRRPSKQREKPRRYDSFLGETWRECRYAGHPHQPAVIWICAAEAQLKSFVKAADPQLTSAIVRRPVGHTGYPVKARSDNATWPGREQIAWTSRERIQAGQLGNAPSAIYAVAGGEATTSIPRSLRPGTCLPPELVPASAGAFDHHRRGGRSSEKPPRSARNAMPAFLVTFAACPRLGDG